MNLEAEWILQHGWGFDTNCWKSWVDEIPSSIKLQILDRGYFGAHKNYFESKGKFQKKVLVVYSLGLHLAPDFLFDQIDILAVIGGFQHFHPDPKDLKFQSQEAVAEMKKWIEENPRNAIVRFYQNCFNVKIELPFKIPEYLNSRLLIDDLDYLDKSVFEIKKAFKIPKILFLHGDADAVVPLNKSFEMHERLKQSQLKVIPGASHALPITHANDCIQAILKLHS